MGKIWHLDFAIYCKVEEKECMMIRKRLDFYIFITTKSLHIYEKYQIKRTKKTILVLVKSLINKKSICNWLIFIIHNNRLIHRTCMYGGDFVANERWSLCVQYQLDRLSPSIIHITTEQNPSTIVYDYHIWQIIIF